METIFEVQRRTEEECKKLLESAKYLEEILIRCENKVDHTLEKMESNHGA